MRAKHLWAMGFLWAIGVQGCSSQSLTAFDATNDSIRPTKHGLHLVYDSDSLLYKKVWYSMQGEVDSMKMYDLQGIEISSFVAFDKLSVDCVSKIRSSIIKEFNWKNVSPQDGKGTVIVSFFLTPNMEIRELRIIRGIHRSLDNEVKRSVSTTAPSNYACAKDTSKWVHVLIGIKI